MMSESETDVLLSDQDRQQPNAIPHILQDKWREIPADSPKLEGIGIFKKSSRNGNYRCKYIAYDTIRFGLMRSPSTAYSPYLNCSLIKSAKQSIDTDTDDETEEQQNDVISTLPIYGGGNNVRLRECDNNRIIFNLNESDWASSWLYFEVFDDKLLTSNDAFIGAVSIDINDIELQNKIYYIRLPLINKKHDLSKNIKYSAKETYNKQLSILSVSDAYDNDQEDDQDDDDEHIDELISFNPHISVSGMVHIKCIRINDNQFEITILRMTHLTTLKLAESMNKRNFYLSILVFVMYLLFYAFSVFIAEYDTDTGMNHYKESIWFALITVTTLGYGDIVAETELSKILNSFFILINVFFMAYVIGLVLNFIVDSGEEILNTRMSQMIGGIEDVEQNKSKQIDVQILNNNQKQIVNNNKSIQSQNATEKPQKVKLKQLAKMQTEKTGTFRTQICINAILFILTFALGFCGLAITNWLTGPNWLTNPIDPDVIEFTWNNVIIDGIYYVIVSMSTVGYGDIYPQVGVGPRIVGALFILFGTMILVRLLETISDYISWKHTLKKKRNILLRSLTSSRQFFEFNTDSKDGSVSKFEYFKGMLLKLDLVESDRIDNIMMIFDKVDTSNDGIIDKDELKAKVENDALRKRFGNKTWKEVKELKDQLNEQKQRYKIKEENLRKELTERITKQIEEKYKKMYANKNLQVEKNVDDIVDDL